MISLKSCPKCGGKGKLLWGPHNFRTQKPKSSKDHKGHKKSTFALVQCLNRECNFKTEKYTPVNGESAEVLKERAILAWNLIPRESTSNTISDT